MERLEAISSAVDKLRQRVEEANAKHRALLLLQDAVKDVRKNGAPAHLRDLRKNYADAALTEAQWKNFQLVFTGDVDAILAAEIKATADRAKLLSGPAKGEIEPELKAAALHHAVHPAGR